MTTPEDFRTFAHSLIDLIVDYKENLCTRSVNPSVEPGFLREKVSDRAPQQPDKWGDLLQDIEDAIIPGLMNWHSPHFHGHFPTANSYPSILADLLCSGLACEGFSWDTGPAVIELEMHMVDWLGMELNLPDLFLFKGKGKGGGIIQGTAEESILITIMTARAVAIERFREKKPNAKLGDGEVMDTLVAYASEQCHPGVEKAAMYAGVRLRLLPVDEQFELTGQTLAQAMMDDKDLGLTPFWVCSTMGTMSSCSFDHLHNLGPICSANNVWLHVDGSFVGCNLILPELQPLMKGIKYADSFNMSPHRCLLVGFDCAVLWVKDSRAVEKAYRVDRSYLESTREENHMPQFKHWGVSIQRRYRALKLWFVFRLYGMEKLRSIIRNERKSAIEFKTKVEKDSNFELVAPVTVGFVPFRLKEVNDFNEALVRRINRDGRICISKAIIGNSTFLRFVVCDQTVSAEDARFAWNVIKEASIVEKISRQSREVQDEIEVVPSRNSSKTDEASDERSTTDDGLGKQKEVKLV